MALLQRVCLFRLGVDAKMLASIFTGEGKEGISGPELAKLSLEDLGSKLQKLAAMRLIERSAGEKGEGSSFIDHASSFSVHPAVRDGFLAGLDAETAQRGHDAAREGLEASLGEEPGDNPSDAVTLDLLEEIVYHTLAAGHAQEAWDIYESRMGQYENLGWRLGAYERGERICRAFAGGQPPQTAPLPDGLPESIQATFINEWALYLSHLGRLDAAARCYERNIEMRMARENREDASRGNQNLADVLLLAGRLAAGLRAAEEALRLAERADDAWGRCHSHAYRGHARGLRGKTDAALTDFRDALHWQHKAEGKTDQPLYSNRGYWHTDMLARLGQYEEARRLTEANKSILLEFAGPRNYHEPLCNLVLADLARERGDPPGARKLLAEAHEWAIARDAKEPLCWSALVRARIELSAFPGAPGSALRFDSSQLSASEDRGGEGDAVVRSHLAAAKSAIEEGLRIARDCGFGIYHIDLLLLRAQVALHEGRADDAEHDIRVALDEGVHPPDDTGLPELLAANDKECGYAWGIAEGRQLLAEAHLLQAAQKLGSRTYKPRSRKTPTAVCELIKSARVELQKCVRLRRRIRDP
jgi:tetratricopeptide (TPR) repeat protein